MKHETQGQGDLPAVEQVQDKIKAGSPKARAEDEAPAPATRVSLSPSANGRSSTQELVGGPHPASSVLVPGGVFADRDGTSRAANTASSSSHDDDDDDDDDDDNASTPTAATDTATATATSQQSLRKSSLVQAHTQHQHEGFVAPSSYLRRPRGYSKPLPMPALKVPETAVDRDQAKGLKSIRDFLKVRTSYDVLPMSFRLIILDTQLLVKKSLNILNQNGIVSAPLWDSATSTFAGLLTTSDYINVVQYYWAHPDALSRMEQLRLSSLREIEKAINVAQIETISVHPLLPLYEACTRMIATRARRMPIVDIDDDTRREMVVSVITQYRILKFIAVNVTETQLLRKPLSQLNLGTYEKLETARMETPVIEVIHQLVHGNISSVPILNTDGIVVNVFEAVDVITLIKGGAYDDLSLSVGEALQKRPADFPGIYTCSLDDRLDSIFDTIRKSRVHRFVVIDQDTRLKGLLSLSDILEYVLLNGSGEER